MRITVGPRFEIFYALQALESGQDARLEVWARDAKRRMGSRLRRELRALAPSPLLWPLLADALRDAPDSLQVNEIQEYLRALNDDRFQGAVLDGVFKSSGAADALVSGKTRLAAIVASEAPTRQRLLSLLGLFPFRMNSPSAVAMTRILEEPASYRARVVDAVGSFWNSAFEATWRELEPRMQKTAKRWKLLLADKGFGAFAETVRLPISASDGAVGATRGGDRVPFRSVAGIHVIPSAFNRAGLWAAYAGAKRTRFFIPLLDPDLLVADGPAPDPALVFKALGDTTRYAMASMIARQPMTSVQLARVFSVSKPTISHHVQLLRSAGLLDEKATDQGVELSLRRGAVEGISGAAARELFSPREERAMVRRSRRPVAR